MRDIQNINYENFKVNGVPHKDKPRTDYLVQDIFKWDVLNNDCLPEHLKTGGEIVITFTVKSWKEFHI
jgi:hypothetical protein